MTYHDILHIILNNIKSILKITLISTIILLIILLIVYPYSYQAQVVVLPPEKSSSMNGLSSILSGQDFSDLFTASISNASSQLYIEILKSRSASIYVLKKLNLQKKYDKNDIYSAAKKLSDDLEIDINKEGMIKLSVNVNTNIIPLIFDNKNEKKKLAADLSNTFIEALDKINREKLVSKSRRARIFIEAQLEETKIKLDSVENALMDFQKKNKTISLPDQLKSAIESAANLKTEIAKTEVELGLMKYNVNENDRAYISLKKKLEQLNEQYAKIELGNEDYFVAFKDVPALGKELSSLVREVKIQNEVYMMLQQQYYKEKIQENRDLPTVEILDEAVPPTKKASPRTIVSMVFGGIFIFLFVSLIFVILANKQKRAKQIRSGV
ncbi:MAG: GNVR domain-containing protein [Ignavibacteriaceae bacterium]